ncbi:hypothetical protein [Cuspidothrix issatschenkoi]|nr:hypothetical protein [Cuspidothrix issatschenkoi]
MIPTLTSNYSNNNSIKSYNSRRHIDPPWLWIAVSIGSVSLHVLVFSLFRSSGEFPVWFPPSNHSSIPVDFIEIATEPKSIIKTKSAVSPSLKSPPITPNKEDDGEILAKVDLTQENKTQKPQVQKPEVQKPQVQKPEVQKPQVQKPEVQKPQVQKPEVQKPEVQKPQVQKPEPEKPPIRQQSYPTNPTPETTPIIPESERPWNRRQEVKLGKGTLLPQDIPADSPTPTPEPSPTVNGGGAVATITPMLKQEVSKLIQQKQLIADALPDVFAEYKGSREKELEPSLLPGGEGLKPANILASLIIDKNGHFQQVIVIDIEPATLRSETNMYEEALNQIFQEENFLAAYNQDGSKPDLSNLYIRLKIQPINSQ